MFDEFLKNCPIQDKIKPSKKRVKNNIAALNSLIETEEGTMTKRKFRLKPLLIIAITILSLSLITAAAANAVTQGGLVRFFMGGREIEGEYYDYVDKKGYRQVYFGATIPLYERNFAVIYDVDAPRGENVRVLTKETDPDFFEKLLLLSKARDASWEGVAPISEDKGMELYGQPVNEKYPAPKNFGLELKDSELGVYHFEYVTERGSTGLCSGYLGGHFMNSGAAYGMPSGAGTFGKDEYDFENETRKYNYSFYYYVGKEE